MDADIKALENEVAKINPPLQPPLIPPQNVSAAYGPSRGPVSSGRSAAFHPYGPPPAGPNTAALLQQQQMARSAASAIAQAQVQAVRLRAQAAAITAARTRTLMSAAAQAQAARSRTNTYSGRPSGPQRAHHPEHGVAAAAPDGRQPLSVGPSYTKTAAVSSYHRMKANYKRFEYGADGQHQSGVPVANHSLRCQEAVGKSKRKRLRATHQYQLRAAASEQWVDPTMTDWPEKDFRIFCGDLGNEVSDAMLTSAFSKYPSFAKAKVVRDKRTGKSKGYGFVSFLEPTDFIRAFKEMNGKYVGNRPIKLRKSKWKERMKKVKNFRIRK